MRRERIAGIVDKLIEEYRTRDPILLARYLGFKVLERDLPGQIAGLVAEVFGAKFILLQTDLPEPEKNYIIAHEIFHCIDQHPDFVFIRRRINIGGYEAESDLFAASLLINEEPEWGETVEHYARRTGVPVKLVRLWFRKAA